MGESAGEPRHVFSPELFTENFSAGIDYLGLSIGSFVMVYKVLLYIVCGFVIQSWILPLYSVVTYAAASKNR